MNSPDYPRYLVIAEFEIKEGPSALWFGEPGGGMQLCVFDENGEMLTINDLLKLGWIVEIFP